MVKTSFLAMSALSAVASAANDTYYTGDGTSYVMDPMAMKTGNCNFQGGWYDNELDIYAAINAEQWGLDQCGKCAEVTCIDSRCSAELQTQKHIVHVIDKCPECLFGALDMAAPVYKLITGRTPDRYKIKWRFVDCPNIKGNLMYCLQPSSKEWWGAVQVSNFKVPIAKVSINGKPAQQMANVDYWLIETSQAIDYTKLTISTTAVSGETITETVSVSLNGCTEGKQQFTQGGSTPAPTTTTLTPAPTSTTSTPAPTSTTSTPAPTSTTSTPVPTTTTTTPAPTSASPGAAMWGQCGGNGWSGPTTCSQGKCVKVNDWYSQCQ